jgi:hypothetical protein
VDTVLYSTRVGKARDRPLYYLYARFILAAKSDRLLQKQTSSPSMCGMARYKGLVCVCRAIFQVMDQIDTFWLIVHISFITKYDRNLRVAESDMAIR